LNNPNVSPRIGAMKRLAVGIAALLALAGCMGGGEPRAGDGGCVVPRLAAAPERDTGDNHPGRLPTPVLRDDEVAAIDSCLAGFRRAGFGRSDIAAAREYHAWQRFATRPWRSEHGWNLDVFGNPRAGAYARAEESGVLPEGAIVAKHGFRVGAAGEAIAGPLFLMEKMRPGFNAATNDWRFTLVAPDGRLIGETAGRDAAAVQFCADCHQAARRQDFLLYVPAPLRRSG
jgi:hypothetical protein